MRQCFFSSNAGKVRCIFTQTKQLSLKLHPTHMVKTKEKHIPPKSKNHIFSGGPGGGAQGACSRPYFGRKKNKK